MARVADELPRFGTAGRTLHADTEFAGLIRAGLIPPHSQGPTHTQAAAERAPQSTRPDEPVKPAPKPHQPKPLPPHHPVEPPPKGHLPPGAKLTPGLPGVHDTVVAATGITDLDSNDEWNVYLILTQQGDPATIRANALAYIRGTAWHQARYPGFAAGVKSGLFGDEAGYEGWRSQVSGEFKRYYQREPTSAELLSYATQGFTPTVVHQIGEGRAYIAANRGDIQYLSGAFDTGQLTPEELTAYGEQQAGRTSELGARVQARLQAATAKLQRLFEGTLAQSNMQLPRGTPQPGQRPDVAA